MSTLEMIFAWKRSAMRPGFAVSIAERNGGLPPDLPKPAVRLSFILAYMLHVPPTSYSYFLFHMPEFHDAGLVAEYIWGWLSSFGFRSRAPDVVH